jgi:MSHA pilin protein MshA
MKSNGFTLIELVVVIVLLGILAATAAPKFINLSADARTATLQGVKATMQGAAALVHSKSLVKGNQKLSAATVNIGDGQGAGGAGELNITYGYPVASIGEWRRIIDVEPDFSYRALGGTGGSVIAIYPSEGVTAPINTAAPCIVYYAKPINENSMPVITINECV